MTALETLAERVSQGSVLTLDDAAAVLASHDLITIGMMADDVKRRMHGVRTTFLRAFEMHVDAVPSTLPADIAAGELRIVGTPASLESALAAVAAARRLAGENVLTGFSLVELDVLAQSSSTLWSDLRSAGLDGIAEAPIDRLSGAAFVDAAHSAGLSVHRITVHAHSNDLLGLLASVMDLQRAAGGIRAFAPLPRTMSITTPTTGYDDIKAIALARLTLADIPSIQVDWPLYGPKLAQVALTMGADDVDGVVAADPGTLGTRRSALEEIKGSIRAAGFEPVERNGRYEAL